MLTSHLGFQIILLQSRECTPRSRAGTWPSVREWEQQSLIAVIQSVEQGLTREEGILLDEEQSKASSVLLRIFVTINTKNITDPAAEAPSQGQYRPVQDAQQSEQNCPEDS